MVLFPLLSSLNTRQNRIPKKTKLKLQLNREQKPLETQSSFGSAGIQSAAQFLFCPLAMEKVRDALRNGDVKQEAAFVHSTLAREAKGGACRDTDAAVQGPLGVSSGGA